jgi:hypothetical protein
MVGFWAVAQRVRGSEIAGEPCGGRRRLCDSSAKFFQNFKKEGIGTLDWPFSTSPGRYTNRLRARAFRADRWTWTVWTASLVLSLANWGTCFEPHVCRSQSLTPTRSLALFLLEFYVCASD